MADNVSVETTHLTKAASHYDSVSQRVTNLLSSFTQLQSDLATACGNDETGQKIHASLSKIKSNLVEDTRLLAEVTGQTADGVRDMRDAYEQAETDAEKVASGVDPDKQIGTGRPNTTQDGNGNSSNTNTSSGNRGKH